MRYSFIFRNMTFYTIARNALYPFLPKLWDHVQLNGCLGNICAGISNIRIYHGSRNEMSLMVSQIFKKADKIRQQYRLSASQINDFTTLCTILSLEASARTRLLPSQTPNARQSALGLCGIPLYPCAGLSRDRSATR